MKPMVGSKVFARISLTCGSLALLSALAACGSDTGSRVDGATGFGGAKVT
jgi:hypothetical protein